MGMTATEEALLRAIWGALEAQDARVKNYVDFTQIDANIERGQLAFNIISRLSAEGMVVVPKVASRPMMLAGQAEITNPSPATDDFSEVWSAMIAAASAHHMHEQQRDKPDEG